MGAGCYYTHPCNRERAAWIDIECDDDDENPWKHNDAFDFLTEDVKGILHDIGYKNMENRLAKIDLVPTYYGDGLIVQISPRVEEYESSYNLFKANFDRMQNKIWRALQKAGYVLKIATSGYTSAKLEKI